MSQTTNSTPPRRRRRRVWTFRIAAILFPLLLLGILELAFRIAGAYEDQSWRYPYVAYEEEGRYFPQWERTLVTPKPAGVYRIIALGGSTTMGARVKHAFPEKLARILAERRPGKRWEFVNAGVIAMSSRRIYEVMKEASRFEPDLYVVCMGNNEFLGDFPLDRKKLESTANRIRLFARKLRVVNFVRRMFRSEKPHAERIIEKHVAREPDPAQPLIHSREHYETRLLGLQANTRLMIDFAKSQGTRIVFVPTAPNLLYMPGNSVHGPGFDGNEIRWRELMASGRAEYAQRKWDAAISAFKDLVEIDDLHAGAHYDLGLSLLGARRAAEARTELLLANQHDQRGAHANSEIVDLILDTCREHLVETVDVRMAFDGYLQVDYDRLFRRNEPPVLFADHCHPTEVGHQIIAEALAELLLAGD